MKNKNQKIKINFLYKIILPVFVLFLFSAQNVFASEISEQNLLTQINKERSQRHLPALAINPDLENAAKLKSKDMINRNYFDHYAFGLSPWDFMKISGYHYLYAGENLAMDFGTSEGIVNAWMASPKHRENILNSAYTDTGFGIVKGAYVENGNIYTTTMVTNMFGRKKPSILKVYDYITKGFLSNIF